MEKTNELGGEAGRVNRNARIAMATVVVVGLILVPLEYMSIITVPVTAFLVFAAFCLGCCITSRIVGCEMSRRLAEQESRLESEFVTERDSWRQMERKTESAMHTVSQVVGMLLADKRKGDIVIGNARKLLEGVLRRFILPSEYRTQADEAVELEMRRRLGSVDCSAEMINEIVEGAMEHTPRAATAVAKLQSWARIIMDGDIPTTAGDSMVVRPQAVFCERAVSVKLTPET